MLRISLRMRAVALRIRRVARPKQQKGVDASSAGETLNAPEPNGNRRSPSWEADAAAAAAAVAAAVAVAAEIQNQHRSQTVWRRHLYRRAPPGARP